MLEDKMKPKPCEICGYKAKKSLTVVQECADGVYRCHVCRETAMYGKYTPEREWLKDPKPQTTVPEWDQYINEIKNDTA
jgi:ribosome-binding protein aMBF1 (putative translation factor)